PGPRALGDGLEAESRYDAISLVDRLLVEVQAVEDGLLREEGGSPPRACGLWRMGCCERKVNPLAARASSGASVTARSGRSLSSSPFRRARIACSLTSASLRCFLIDASRRSSPRSLT